MPFRAWGPILLTFSIALLVWRAQLCASSGSLNGPRLGDDRIVFQTEFGDIEMALYPDVTRIRKAPTAPAQPNIGILTLCSANPGSPSNDSAHTQASKTWGIQ